MELMLFTCARSIHINTDRKQLKQVLHFRFSFEPKFSEVDKSLFLAPPLRTTSCNVHYSGPILYDNERETWSKSKFAPAPYSAQKYVLDFPLDRFIFMCN